jgi:hypothetical protein
MFAAMMAIAIAAPVHADAWARGRGRTYVHLGIAAMNADTAFDPSGERVPFPGRGSRRSRANLYAEIGLTGALTFVANTPYERVTSRGLFNDFTTAGGGDLDLRLRLTRQTAAGAFALEGGAYLPLGYDRSAFPQLGTGTIDPIVNAAYGTSISALPEGFVSAQIGYRSRGGGVSDELPYSVKAGAFFHPRVGTFVAIRGWESRGDFRRIDPSFALTAADSESLSAGGEMYVRLTPRFHINAGWSRPVRGRNHAIGNEWSVGIAVKNR